MQEHSQPLTPAALYARVSSDRQDVDLSVAAQLRALRDYAKANDYVVAREYVDEAESGRIADRPEFRKMIDAAAKANGPFREILVWKFSRFTRKREHAVAFKSMLRRKGRSSRLHHRARRRHPHRQAHGGHHRERGRVLLGESSPGGHEGDAGVRLSRLLGLQLRPLRLQPGDGAGRGQEAPNPGDRPDASRIVKRIFDTAEAGNGMVNITRTLNDEGILSPRGKLWGKTSIHAILINESYTGLWSGALIQRTMPSQCGWRRRSPPSSPRPSSAASTS